MNATVLPNSICYSKLALHILSLPCRFLHTKQLCPLCFPTNSLLTGEKEIAHILPSPKVSEKHNAAVICLWAQMKLKKEKIEFIEQNHRIIGLSQLKKTFKITKPNHPPDLPTPITKSHPSVPSTLIS